MLIKQTNEQTDLVIHLCTSIHIQVNIACIMQVAPLHTSSPSSCYARAESMPAAEQMSLHYIAIF